MNQPAPSPNTTGQRFVAALLGVPCVAVPIFFFAANAPYWFGFPIAVLEMIVWLAIPLGFFLGWRFSAVRGSRNWKWLGTICGLLVGAQFGHVMEGAEGAAWGSLIGIVAGFSYGLYAPWIASVIPARWGVIAAGAGLGILLFLVPLLVAMRLFFGKFDGDDFAFAAFAVVFGIQHAASRGWWESGEFRPQEVRIVLINYLRRWLDPRLLVWAIAFLVPGLIVGSYQNLYSVYTDTNFSIVIDASSWYWPSSLCLAATLGLLLACRKTSLRNRAYLVFCGIVLLISSHTLIGHYRFKVLITPETLHIRHGIFGSIDLSRADLKHIETETARGRRFVVPYSILVTHNGQRHSLRSVPHSDKIKQYLIEQWQAKAP